jgi:hypothetical protein
MWVVDIATVVNGHGGNKSEGQLSRKVLRRVMGRKMQVMRMLLARPAWADSLTLTSDSWGKTYRFCKKHESQSMHDVDFSPNL